MTTVPSVNRDIHHPYDDVLANLMAMEPVDAAQLKEERKRRKGGSSYLAYDTDGVYARTRNVASERNCQEQRTEPAKEIKTMFYIVTASMARAMKGGKLPQKATLYGIYETYDAAMAAFSANGILGMVNRAIVEA